MTRKGNRELYLPKRGRGRLVPRPRSLPLRSGGSRQSLRQRGAFTGRTPGFPHHGTSVGRDGEETGGKRLPSARLLPAPSPRSGPAPSQTPRP